MLIVQRQSIDFIKKQAENITALLTKEHRRIIEKFQGWIDVAILKADRNAHLEQLAIISEMYSAKTNPVLQANYGLDDDTPLALYDCLVPTLQSRRHGNPYDCFEIETIANWHEVKAENERLMHVIKNYEHTHEII